MESTTIYLVRHGEVENPNKVYYGRQLDLHLSTKGKIQIETLSKKLKNDGIKLQRIYTSPLSRALESAQIISNVYIGVKIIKEDGLNETDIPALVGHPTSEQIDIRASGQDEYSGEFIKKGNESGEQITKRMYAVFNKIRKENEDKDIAIVSHGDPIRFLLYRLENPDNGILSMSQLMKSDYIDRGAGWKLVVDETGRILEKYFISIKGILTERV